MDTINLAQASCHIIAELAENDEQLHVSIFHDATL